jgi:ABC-2 type transport system ATP-binding protein
VATSEAETSTPAQPIGNAVEVHGLRKSYRDVAAVKGIDFEIRHGEIFALLGPNGAGKTTTVEILEGYRSRDAGEVEVLGFDPAHRSQELRSRIGIVLQSTGVDSYLTVAESISMYSSYYPRRRPVDEVVELVGLEEKRDTRVLRLSGGQQRRLDVAIALAGDPDLLFLDEPTTGFDPAARREAWEVVKNLAAIGKTILLTTHFMDEAQYLADRVAVIAGGEIVASGPPESIGGRDSAKATVRFHLPAGAAPPPALGAEAREDGGFEVAPDSVTRTLHELTGWAIEQGLELEALQIVRPSLEDVYLQLTGPNKVHSNGGSAGAGRRRRRSR